MPSLGRYRPGATRPGSFPRTLGSTYRFTIQGYAITASGSVESFATINLFAADAFKTLIGTTTADAAGFYSFNPPTNSGNFIAMAVSQDGLRSFATTPTLVAV